MIHRLIVGIAAGWVSVSAGAAAPLETSVRPPARPEVPGGIVTNEQTKGAAFAGWTREFRARARSRGISDEVLNAALRDLQYDAEVVRRDRNQSEFTKTIWDYLDTAVSAARVENGKAALKRHRSLMEQVEDRYGVPKEIVVAIWGLESAYGAFRGNDNILQSLSTLAFDGRRGPFFETQLMAALQILQSGDTTPSAMRGSWAGAMGHTQFMPTSYLSYAVDFDGDGKRDIWSDDPTDALASTGAYLARFGWITGQPWGAEVVLPDGFDYALSGMKTKKSPAEWAALGVRDIEGDPIPNHGPASILLPGGAEGAAFMIFKNFNVLERYNTADAYVIGVGHLADRIAGGPPIQSGWPRGDRALTLAERRELQERLTAAGFDTQGIDGKIGPLTIAAVRGFQNSIGLIPDGYASLRILERLR